MLDVECAGCGAALQVEPHLRTATCPWCDSPSVLERPPQPGRPTPAFALGFSLTAEAARARVGKWLRRASFFAPSAVRNATLERVRGVYLPAWLYSAQASTRYEAEIGENYTVRYTTTENGRTVTRTREETEWYPLSGTHDTFVSDVLVTASRGLSNDELERLEPFDLRLLRRYDPAVVSGWIAEDPTLSHEASLVTARDEATALVGRQLQAFMPGDGVRGLRWVTAFSREGSELILIPVWVLAARWHPQKPPMRVVMNGQSGQIHGKTPVSVIKVCLCILGALALLAAVLYVLQYGLPGGGP